MTITTHVLDTSTGRPGAGIVVRLEQHDGARWLPVDDAKTNADGRIPGLATGAGQLPAGQYRLIFEIGAYFAARQIDTFYPRACVEFIAAEETGHYHVPLLVSPYGYSTYRGS